MQKVFASSERLGSCTVELASFGDVYAIWVIAPGSLK